jgi:hypothetical protein
MELRVRAGTVLVWLLIHSGWMIAYLVGTVRRHGRSEHNRSFHALLNERARRASCRVKRSIQVDAPQLINLLSGKVERSLVLRSAGIAHHSVQSACLLEDLFDCRLDGLFFCYVGLKREELVRVLRGEGGEFVASLANIDAVDFGGAVGEAAICYAETDAWRRLALGQGVM